MRYHDIMMVLMMRMKHIIKLSGHFLLIGAYNVGVILVNIITLILFCCSNQKEDGWIGLTSKTLAF